MLTDLMRCLFFYGALFQFQFSASHIAGVSNWVADAISRNELSIVFSSFPQARQVSIIDQVTQFLLNLPDWGSAHWMSLFTASLYSASPITLYKQLQVEGAPILAVLR